MRAGTEHSQISESRWCAFLLQYEQRCALLIRSGQAQSALLKVRARPCNHHEMRAGASHP
eukprot:1151426-Pelagomonas_calceolata.AAC.9